MGFATGSRGVPVLGFTMQPTIKSIEGAIVPTATTCVNALYLPLTDNMDFAMMDLAFVNAHFGMS